MGLQGIYLQALQTEPGCIPLTLHLHLPNAQRHGLAAGRSTGAARGLQLGRKAHGGAVALGTEMAIQGCGIQLAVQRSRCQLLHLGAGLHSTIGGGVAALQHDLARAYLQCGLGDAPLGAIKVGTGVQRAQGQALCVPGARQVVAQLGA